MSPKPPAMVPCMNTIVPVPHPVPGLWHQGDSTAALGHNHLGSSATAPGPWLGTIDIDLVHVYTFMNPCKIVLPSESMPSNHNLKPPSPPSCPQDSYPQFLFVFLDDRVIIPVSSFILANSSLSVISYNHCAACPPGVFPLGNWIMPTSQLLSSSMFPLR
jgi:hypothetical protein